MANITFTDISQQVQERYYPTPASASIPDWYKSLDSYIGGKRNPINNGQPNATIKRCMPVFDAMVNGYIIYSPVDVFVVQEESVDEAGNSKILPIFKWGALSMVLFHLAVQAPNHPDRGSHINYPKWNSPWAIKTPKGYSTFFTTPVHRDLPFSILPGVVDTDSYTAPVAFPFVLKDTTFEGVIPAGTPIAQVIPFKRESWKMSIGGEKELKEQDKITYTLRHKIFDTYKNQYRQTKDYK